MIHKLRSGCSAVENMGARNLPSSYLHRNGRREGVAAAIHDAVHGLHIQNEPALADFVTSVFSAARFNSRNRYRRDADRTQCSPQQPSPHRLPGQFDFYVLNLYWSPEFCHGHPSAVECGWHRAFTLHGLWPQSTDGTYPEDCSDAPSPASPPRYADIYPRPHAPATRVADTRHLFRTGPRCVLCSRSQCGAIHPHPE
jgi:ribonuclease I